MHAVAIMIMAIMLAQLGMAKAKYVERHELTTGRALCVFLPALPRRSQLKGMSDAEFLVHKLATVTCRLPCSGTPCRSFYHCLKKKRSCMCKVYL